MRVHRDAEVPEDERGLVCRQSRLAGVVRFVLLSGAFAAAPVLCWKFHHPLFVWVGSIIAAIVIPVLLIDTTRLFRATNWKLRVGCDGVRINLKSYRDKPWERASVVHLEYGEIACVGRHTESYSTPSKMATGSGSYGAVGGSTIWRDAFLEIRLNHEQTDELAAALNDLRHGARPGQEPSQPARARNQPFPPLWLVSPGVLRIAWVSGHGQAFAPLLRRVLARLETYVTVAEPTRRKRPDWRKLSAEQVDELARELVRVHGATSEATTLLVRAGGFAYADATRLVQRFDEEGEVTRPA